MIIRKFFSLKYQKYIQPDNRHIWTVTKDEALLRLTDIEKNELRLYQSYGRKRKASEILKTFQS